MSLKAVTSFGCKKTQKTASSQFFSDHKKPRQCFKANSILMDNVNLLATGDLMTPFSIHKMGLHDLIQKT